ncbi:CAMK/CAMKL/Kin4 protein kinase [Ephemerocybe angulata]|uniref:non-specific serine/threonine protein kinase n=1 Tax=Ephemerocybe angulata TaxID=980116 RepID=A0A8H6HPL2_9AGAR|nr:CAMK/CAMKL/Kin4 protein kinase [Tulosesus angulatus]
MAPNPHSTSLQIPQVDPDIGSSRQGGSHNTPGQSPSASQYRPASVAVHSATPSSPNNHSQSTVPRRQQRASHSVVSGASNTQDQSGNSRHDTPLYPDVYAHPAAVAYAAAHSRRPIPRFGPYLLLQTLGEGEFGKVKLGLHCQWGEEVAVKLIRRGNIDSTVRMSKVEREIEVLRALKHPNIVRLYDVIETDKYIGIILEYASGGELFDHILAHRYLREKDAAKLFSQLISGVWYIHQKKIVHRDLKLENLLLDRHRNVIITDFGFANKFEHRSDDLMQTSCGSPCYAAPELVISEGLYVGSAVDIWSCGVILYAMLAGYLPFDDDPANPDGDNINLLYKYIVNTPLSFPEYVSAEARDLLSLMLVPDPTRRANLDTVMRHPWLAAYQGQMRTDGVPAAFGKSVSDLEKLDQEQRHQKRLAYKKQVKANAALNNEATPSRTQSHRPEPSSGTPSASTRSRSNQPEYLYDSSVDQSHSVNGSNINATPKHNGTTPKTFESPVALGLSEDDPFAPAGTTKRNSVVITTTTTTTTTTKSRTSEDSRQPPSSSTLSPTADTKAPSSSKGHRSSTSGSGGGGFRHTIQVEYDDKNAKKEDKKRDRSGSQGQVPVVPSSSQPTPTKERRPSQSAATKPLPVQTSSTPSSYRAPPTPATPKANTSPTGQVTPKSTATKPETPNISVSSPPPTPSFQGSPSKAHSRNNSSQTSLSSVKRTHKKGKSSIDKLGLGKIFGNGSAPPPVPPLNSSGSRLQSPGTESPSRVPSDGHSNSSSTGLGSSSDKEQPAEKGKKSRRNTLTVMVEPFLGTMRRKAKGGSTTPATTDGASVASGASLSKASQLSSTYSREPQSAVAPSTANPPPSAYPASAAPRTQDPDFDQSQDLPPESYGMRGSTSKANKVMQWFRTKSKGRESVGIDMSPYEGDMEKEATPTQGKYRKGFSASSNTVNQVGVAATAGLNESVMSPQVVVTQAPQSASAKFAAPGHPTRSASTAHGEASSQSFVTRFRNSVTVGGLGSSSNREHSSSSKVAASPHGTLRIHHGAVDQTTITTRPPPEVMAHVKKVLEGMGVEVQYEHDYKYRCIRAKKKKGSMTGSAASSGSSASASLAAVQMSGSAASNGVDKRGLPLPSPSAFAGTGGMLRGLLMRRQSSQVSTSASQPSLAFDDETSVVVSEPLVMNEAAYGDPTQDAGDEVRFSVELTRIDRLSDTYSLDVRRLKGNLRSYKYLYDTIRERADLQS